MGNNNDEELSVKESEIREMVYNLTKMIVTIFNKLEDLQDFRKYKLIKCGIT